MATTYLTLTNKVLRELNETELIRDPDSFADVVRGLHVFGRKILRSEAVQRGVITIG